MMANLVHLTPLLREESIVGKIKLLQYCTQMVQMLYVLIEGEEWLVDTDLHVIRRFLIKRLNMVQRYSSNH